MTVILVFVVEERDYFFPSFYLMIALVGSSSWYLLHGTHTGISGFSDYTSSNRIDPVLTAEGEFLRSYEYARIIFSLAIEPAPPWVNVSTFSL